MGVDLVLNELSYRSPVEERYEAKQAMAKLIETMRAAHRLGVQRELRCHEDLYRSRLANDYSVTDWLSDGSVDQVAREFFRTVATASPFLRGLEGSEADEQFGASEFTFRGEPAIGLGVAFILGGLSVSLLLDPVWDRSFVAVDMLVLDAERGLEEGLGPVHHASTKEHVKEHEAWIATQARATALDGRILWAQRKRLLPHLEFCASVRPFVEQLRMGTPMGAQVLRKLFELEDYCRNWEAGPFNPDLLPSRATPESQSTMQHYGSERRILCPDGEYRDFSWHVRFTPGKGRIHFLPLDAQRRIFVGYIGEKLPTSTDPT
jgi:hypothetical protein